ncbi:hypothetical protein [Streptomyces sp. NPDC088736]
MTASQPFPEGAAWILRVTVASARAGRRYEHAVSGLLGPVVAAR